MCISPLCSYELGNRLQPFKFSPGQRSFSKTATLIPFSATILSRLLRRLEFFMLDLSSLSYPTRMLLHTELLSLSLSSRVFSLFALRKIPVPFHRLRLIFDPVDSMKKLCHRFLTSPSFLLGKKFPFFPRENSNAWFFDRESSK